MTTGLLIVAHGSRGGESQAIARTVAAAARVYLGPFPCRAAFLDHDENTPSEALSALAQRGASSVVVVPFFLGAAFHVYEDLPAQLGDAVPYVITEHLGPHPLIIDALIDGIGDQRPESVVLVGAGSKDPNSQAEVRRAAMRLGNRLGVPCSAAFLSSAEPLLEDALSSRPLIVPYLLAGGVFSEKIKRIADARGLTSTPVIGANMSLIELVIQRFTRAARERT